MALYVEAPDQYDFMKYDGTNAAAVAAHVNRVAINVSGKTYIAIDDYYSGVQDLVRLNDPCWVGFKVSTGLPTPYPEIVIVNDDGGPRGYESA